MDDKKENVREFLNQLFSGKQNEIVSTMLDLAASGGGDIPVACVEGYDLIDYFAENLNLFKFVANEVRSISNSKLTLSIEVSPGGFIGFHVQQA